MRAAPLASKLRRGWLCPLIFERAALEGWMYDAAAEAQREGDEAVDWLQIFK